MDTTEYYNPRELAEKLNVSLKFIRSQTQERRVPGQVKIGGMWRYSRAEIEKAMLNGGQFLLSKRTRKQ